MAGKKSPLEQLAEVIEVIQKSSCDVMLQMAGLRFITEVLEEEPGHHKQFIRAEDELAIRSVPWCFLGSLLATGAG